MANTTLYNPASLNKEDLILNFVVRTKTFEKIFKDIEGSEMRYPEKHYILQGQRGMGKTTLLLRLKYEVERNDKLNKWLVPVFFNEESYDVNSLAGLWEKLLRYLDDHFHTDGAYYSHTEKFLDSVDYEKKCFEFLVAKLKEKEKKLIIFFDNFGELFLDNLKDKEKRRLREILIDCADIRIVAASAVVINDLHDYTQPFYEFFHVIRLEGLTKDETYALIAKLQEDCEVSRRIDLKKSKAKIDTLAVLTGGVIRTVMMLYQVLLDDKDGSALEDLEKVLDKVTPLYKHRIEDLPLQQRRIVDVIAKKWDAASAKEIANEIREDGKTIATKLVSAQLNQLEKNNIVEKKETNTKNNLYQLRERFFNIWYLMRNGDRREKRRVAWLTKFLEVWYSDKDELSNFVVNHVNQLKAGKYKPKSALLMIDALLHTDKIEIDNMEMLYEETKAILNEEMQKQLPSISKLRSVKIQSLIKTGEFDLAMDYADRIEDNPILRTQFQLLLSYSKNDKEKVKKILSAIDFNKKPYHENISLFVPFYLFISEFDKIIELNTHHNFANNAKDYDMLTYVYHMKGDKKNETLYSILALKGGRAIPLNVLYQDHYNLDEVLEAFEQGITINKDLKILMLDYLFEKLNENVGLAEYGKRILESINEKQIKKSFKLSFYNLIYSGSLENDKELAIEIDLKDLRSLYKLHNGENISAVKLVQNFLLQVYLRDITLYKNDIKQLIVDIEDIGEIPLLAVYAQALIVNGSFDQAVILTNKIIDKDDDELHDLNPVFMELLAQKQYYSLLKLFNTHEKLKEIFKPTYYALMTLLKDDFPNEILKMGEEIKLPVSEILEKVIERTKQYE